MTPIDAPRQEPEAGMQELIELEERGWQALSRPGAAAREFYAPLLREDAVMLLPQGLRLVGRECILESLGTRPWDDFRIEHARVVALAPDVAVVVYSATARRDRSEPYVALISSTYVRAGSWQLVLHQQTPV